MDFVMIFLNLIFITLSFKALLLIRKDLELKARCTKEVKVKVLEVMRRSSNFSRSEYWTMYNVFDDRIDTLVSSWENFHPYNEGDIGILYINPNNKNEFSYPDKLLVEKNLFNIIPIGIEIFIAIITLIYCLV